jgi:hypothetical protein
MQVDLRRAADLESFSIALDEAEAGVAAGSIGAARTSGFTRSLRLGADSRCFHPRCDLGLNRFRPRALSIRSGQSLRFLSFDLSFHLSGARRALCFHLRALRFETVSPGFLLRALSFQLRLMLCPLRLYPGALCFNLRSLRIRPRACCFSGSFSGRAARLGFRLVNVKIVVIIILGPAALTLGCLGQQIRHAAEGTAIGSVLDGNAAVDIA